ncbi:hypothetical protein CDD83_11065 [Cordyceps sp. RAO-2017]|nr:hypothetical protein CDD83_11065 [Cordyceps sp. RAO-2017]
MQDEITTEKIAGAAIVFAVITVLLAPYLNWMLRVKLREALCRRTWAFISTTCLFLCTGLVFSAFRLPLSRRPFLLGEYVDNLRDPRLAVTVAGLFLFMWSLLLPFNYVLLQDQAVGTEPALISYLLPILKAAR